MPIYDIFDSKETSSNHERMSSGGQRAETLSPPPINPTSAIRDRLVSSIAARLFFLLLLAIDFFWLIYAVTLFLLLSAAALATGLQVAPLKSGVQHYWIALKRSLVCGLALFVALFSPAFGIMIACTYFLMYDKEGIEEVIPSSLQNQFRDFFRQSG